MTQPSDDAQQQDELLLFGTVTASVTHELSNVLSVINESTGLLGDLLAGRTSGEAVDPERIRVIHDRIMRQVERGVNIVRRLNRFAHSADERLAEIDAREEIENIVFLARRFAELSRVSLEANVPDEEIRMTTDPFAVQHVVFRCVQEALGRAAEGDRLVVEIGEDEEFVRVTVGGSSGTLDKGASRWTVRLRDLAQSLGGEAAIGTGDGGDLAIVLRLPRSGPPGG